MDANQYISERLDDQITWYDRRSQWNQQWFKRLQVTQIIAAASIPFLVSLLPGTDLPSKIILGLLGLIIAGLAAFLGLYQLQENWLRYRTTCESLKHEKYIFLTKTDPYQGSDSFPLLVERVESLISRENTSWAQATRSSVEGAQDLPS